MALFSPPLVGLSRSLRSGTSRKNIPDGNAGTAATIREMQRLVSESKRDRLVRNLAGKIIRSCPNKDYLCYAEAIHRYCRDEIRYGYDPVGVEYIESARRVIEAGVADCDSIVILFACLCEQIGLPCKFITIKTSPKEPDEFTHVYAAVKIPGRGWVASDPTMPDKPFGWAPDPKFPAKDWNASLDSPPEGFDEDMSGLGRLTKDRPRTRVGVQSGGARIGPYDSRVATGRWFKACTPDGRCVVKPLPAEWAGYFPGRTAGHMFGLGEASIPGVQDTPGVLVEKPYEFRQEPALITSTPEELELDPLTSLGIDDAPTGEPREYWSRSQIQQTLTEQAGTPTLTVKMRTQGPLSGLGADPDEGRKTTLWLVLGVAGVAILLMARGGGR